MSWDLCEVVEAQEEKRDVELQTFNMLDLYCEFIKAHHTKEEFEAFAEKWCDEHAEEFKGGS